MFTGNQSSQSILGASTLPIRIPMDTIKMEAYFKLIEQGRPLQAMEKFARALGNDNADLQDDVIGVIARYKAVESQKRRGIISHENYQQSYNQFVYAAIDILRSYQELDVIEEPDNTLISTKNKTKILFLAANSNRESMLFFAREVHEIENALRSAKLRDRFDFAQIGWTSPQILIRSIMEHEPAFVHFSGHGTKEGILLMDERDKTKTVRNQSLGKIFQKFSDQISCVLLNSCHSNGQASTIRQYIQTVIGVEGKLSDEAAIRFSIGFYQAIGQGKDPAFAFEIGQLAVDAYNEIGGDYQLL